MFRWPFRRRNPTFQAGWGPDPLELYVPAEDVWDEALPDWLKGRWAEVTKRLGRDSGHVLAFDLTSFGYSDSDRLCRR